MKQVAAGDRSALETVYRMTSAKLLGVIIRLIPDRELAEDVLQEVYIKVWRRAGRYDPDLGSPISWLATVARNSAIDELRKVGSRPNLGEDTEMYLIADDAPPADEMLCEAEEYAAIRACLEKLEAKQRQSIRSAFFKGQTHAQLAEDTGVPLGTMQSWIRRGLSSLKGCLDRSHV